MRKPKIKDDGLTELKGVIVPQQMSFFHAFIIDARKKSAHNRTGDTPTYMRKVQIERRLQSTDIALVKYHIQLLYVFIAITVLNQIILGVTRRQGHTSG